MEKNVKKGIGIFLIIVGLIFGMGANRFPIMSGKFWLFLAIGLAIWYVASFKCLIVDKQQAKTLATWMLGLVFLFTSALTFLYVDAIKGIAQLSERPITTYLIIQGICAVVFVSALVLLAKGVLQQTRQTMKGSKK